VTCCLQDVARTTVNKETKTRGTLLNPTQRKGWRGIQDNEV
jgi:hypothetical protein